MGILTDIRLFLLLLVRGLKCIKIYMRRQGKNADELAFAGMREQIEAYRRAGAQIGKFVRLWGKLDAINPHLVTIGDCTCVGSETCLITHCPINPGKIKIGKNVWIGFRCIILPNVTIGDGALIGAGSVVTSDIPPNSIACGNPAVVIRSRDPKEMKRTIEVIKNDLPVGEVPRQ